MEADPLDADGPAGRSDRGAESASGQVAAAELSSGRADVRYPPTRT